jgi:hypothetical protein
MYLMALVPVGSGDGIRRNLYCIDWHTLQECPANLKILVNDYLSVCKNHSVNPGYFKARSPDAHSWWGDERFCIADTYNPDHMEATFFPSRLYCVTV